MLQWISNPLLLCAVTGAGLLGSLGLWIAAKLELRAIRNEVTESQDVTNTQLQELSANIIQLRVDRESEPEPEVPITVPVTAGLNLTRRSQIVRMHRRGETAATIAAALQAPRNEVELVLKLEKLLNSAA